MVKVIIMFIILAVLWVMVVFNRKLKRTVDATARDMNAGRRNFQWETGTCVCGKPRAGWKALAMNRPDNTVLLICPQCMNLWEEKMTLAGNKWRPVDQTYAREQYNYTEEYGRSRVDSEKI